MKQVLRTFSTVLVMTAFAYAMGISNAYTQTPREYQIKAAFLYHFTKFVDWPANRFPDKNTPLNLCVFGKDPFGPVLEQTVTGKTIKGRSINIDRVQRMDNLKSCHLLFVSSSERQRVPQIVSSIGSAGVLTTGDMDRFAEQGGIINLIKSRNRIKFEINLAAAARAGLKISSKLLKLATIINE